jgi:hypothetical protein
VKFKAFIDSVRMVKGEVYFFMCAKLRKSLPLKQALPFSFLSTFSYSR